MMAIDGYNFDAMVEAVMGGELEEAPEGFVKTIDNEPYPGWGD